MHCVLAAETTILVHFKSFGVILLVLHCVVISLLALGAFHCNFNSHGVAPPSLIFRLPLCMVAHAIFSHIKKACPCEVQ